MKCVKRWRYYCDHCKKGLSSKPAMKRHEAGCCKNAARVCGMCREAELEQQPSELLDATLADGGLDALRKIAAGCPACMLAAVIRERLADEEEYGPRRGDEDPIAGSGFNFRTERDRFWADLNDARAAW